MTKFEKLMPVSHIVRAFCKAMKSLIEDEVVVNDMECQLKAEVVRVSEEVLKNVRSCTFLALITFIKADKYNGMAAQNAATTQSSTS